MGYLTLKKGASKITSVNRKAKNRVIAGLGAAIAVLCAVTVLMAFGVIPVVLTLNLNSSTLVWEALTIKRAKSCRANCFR